jgi:hypothetical protein
MAGTRCVDSSNVVGQSRADDDDDPSRPLSAASAASSCSGDALQSAPDRRISSPAVDGFLWSPALDRPQRRPGLRQEDDNPEPGRPDGSRRARGATRVACHLSLLPLTTVGLAVLRRQVNCFDVVGETDAKTEGVLRARFERAASSSPCILLLRHVEALGRKGQAQETGKGEHQSLRARRRVGSLTSFPSLTRAPDGGRPQGLH